MHQPQARNWQPDSRSPIIVFYHLLQRASLRRGPRQDPACARVSPTPLAIIVFLPQAPRIVSMKTPKLARGMPVASNAAPPSCTFNPGESTPAAISPALAEARLARLNANIRPTLAAEKAALGASARRQPSVINTPNLLLPNAAFLSPERKLPAIDNWFIHEAAANRWALNNAYLEPHGGTLVPLELTSRDPGTGMTAFQRADVAPLALFLRWASMYSPSPSHAAEPPFYLAQHPIAALPAPLQHDLHRRRTLEDVHVFSWKARPASVSLPPGMGLGDGTETETEQELSGRFLFPRFTATQQTASTSSAAPKGQRFEIDRATPSATSPIPASHPPGHANVHIESMMLAQPPAPPQLTGTVLVHNIAYEKNVAVRFTLDDWQTMFEVRESYQTSLHALPWHSKPQTLGDAVNAIAGGRSGHFNKSIEDRAWI
ncbi:carbohydrate-binding module family 21 protein [Athelia psychrophila]|uniref:Carbohydrate-binding module family 21 protein n=1 Tax=Athelia psychrophila TaxID=1759441 RepID=A0A165Z5V6_9AGAM|nr:carbohydrate-binding module family 21 protein [Fibularhizoctonia sp. CBS 109695]